MVIFLWQLKQRINSVVVESITNETCKFDFDFVLKILKMTKNVCNIFRTKLLFVRLFSSLYNFLLLKLTDVCGIIRFVSLIQVTLGSKILNYIDMFFNLLISFYQNIFLSHQSDLFYIIKSLWFNFTEETEMEVESPPEPPPQRVVMKHNSVPNRMMQQYVYMQSN